jgi:carboxymethylenebutenolidase
VAGRALATRPLTELAASLATPVLIHHGEADRNIPAGQARLLHQSLAAAGKSATLFLYPGADHLFDFALGPQAGRLFDPDAAARAWERTLAFLRQHLGH